MHLEEFVTLMEGLEIIYVGGTAFRIWRQTPLQWRHNERHGVSNYQKLRLFAQQSILANNKKLQIPLATGGSSHEGPVNLWHQPKSNHPKI